MVDERDRARARLGLPPLSSTSTAKPTPIVDEQTKARAMRAAAPAPAAAIDDSYYTKVLASGKTQAQIDALRNAYDTAEVIRQNDPTKTSTVDRTTGKVITGTKTVTPPVITEDDKEDDKKGGGRVVVSTYIDPATGDVYAIYSDGSRELLSQGTKALEAAREEQRLADEKRRQGQSAYDLLVSQFSQYGLESLVEDVKKYIQDGLSQSELTLRLRTESKAYQKRFAANAQRVAKGLSALNEAEYIGLEDQYQNIMREYGLPASYYAKGDLGVQAGFEKLLANDVSSTELEDRVLTAQSRVMNANPEVLASLKQFYPGIGDGDILAYALDPEKALTDIKRKVTAAEIGGAAMQAGLKTGVARAEELGAAGITKQQAQQGFQTVAEIAPRGGMLADIYNQSPYTQTTAEAEIFGVAGSAEAARQRKKLTSLETAAFSGSAGAGAIARDRAGVL
jgi:hypothetical protein